MIMLNKDEKVFLNKNFSRKKIQKTCYNYNIGSKFDRGIDNFLLSGRREQRIC